MKPIEKLEGGLWALVSMMAITACGGVPGSDSDSEDAEVVELSNILFALQFEDGWKGREWKHTGVGGRQTFTRRDGLAKLTIDSVSGDGTELSAQLDKFIERRRQEIGGLHMTEAERTPVGESLFADYSGVNARKRHYEETVFVRPWSIMYFHCESRAGELAPCEGVRITFMDPRIDVRDEGSLKP